MTPRYSIVIVSYNCLGPLQACLQAVRLCLAAEPESRTGAGSCGEIVVVDNASRDGTADWLKTQSDLLTVINATNRGFSAACNQGAARARGEFLLFLNPDTWAAPGCLGRMASAFAEPGVGAVGPLSNYVAGLQRLDLQWPPQAKPLAELGQAPHGPNRVNGDVQTVAALVDEIAAELARHRSGQVADTRLLIGFCLMMRRSLYQGMGGMDEDLFLGNDDLDLSWRLRERGMRLRIALDAFVLHEGQKSFKTERKETVDRLVQESTDALYRKLVRHYGSPAQVPPAAVLWGMDWFKPSPEALNQGNAMQQPNQTSASLAKTDRAVSGDFSTVGAMPQASLLTDISVVVPMPALKPASQGQKAQASTLASALAETLASLPADVGEVLLLDAGETPVHVPAEMRLRRLDVGEDMPAGMAIALAARAAKKPYVLLLPAGLQMTAMLGHWLARRDPQDLGQVMPLQVAEAGAPWQGQVKPHIVRRDIWLRHAPASEADWAQVMAELTARVSTAPLSDKAPWLGQSDVAAALWNTKTQDWTPVSDDDRIRLYPETLQVPMRQAKQTIFAGTQAGPIAEGQPLRGLDLSGQVVELAGQDLIILRVTPDMLADLPERMKHLRRTARDMRRLVVVFNGNQAQGVRGDAKGWHVPIDLTVPGMTRALRLAGFTVVETRPYCGFPDAEGKTLQGWHQIEATPRSLAPQLERKVSIVILGFNQAEYTRKCIHSIRAHTRQRYELILVDNGSTDGTWDLFQSIPGAKAIRNAENLGVAAGWNCGLRAAEGDYVCILNNDTWVGEGWIENMVRLLESDASIGMVGPRSNRVAGPQVVEEVGYRRDEEIAGFIEAWNQKHALASEDHDWVKGVCMVMPKAVVDKVGRFDERFGKGNFEDDDYSLRVRLHGFRTCIAHDSFLHHYGSVSFNQAGVDWTEQMRKNQALFESKWARGREALNDVVEAPVAEKKNALADLMAAIEAAYARQDLDAARRELVKAAEIDPGHPEVLNALGIMSFHDGEGREAALCFIRALIARPAYEDAARNLVDALIGLNGEFSEAEAMAFAKRFPENPVFAPAAVEPDWRDAVTSHIASQQFAAALRMIESHLQKTEDRSICFNFMGHIAFELGQYEEALAHFRRALAEPAVVAEAVMNAVDALLVLKRLPEAVNLLARAQAGQLGGVAPGAFQAALMQARHALAQAEPAYEALRADLHAGEEAEEWIEAGNADAARTLLLAHLEVSPKDFRARNNLGLCDYYAGRLEEAYLAFVAALECEPACGDALINACDCAISLGRTEALPTLVAKALAADPQSPEALRIDNLLRREGEAMRLSGSLAELESQQEMLATAETKLRSGEVEAAKRLYGDALQRRPANPQALNGLGIMAFGEKRYEEAYARFSEAARFNPLDQDILINLWEAARAQRREPEALGLLKQSLVLNPDLADIRAIVTAAT